MWAQAIAYHRITYSNRSMPDIVLLDNMMVKLHGPDTAAALRGLNYKGLIIGMMSDIYGEDARVFEVAGANQILAKPLMVKDLRDVVSLWLTVQGGYF